MFNVRLYVTYLLLALAVIGFASEMELPSDVDHQPPAAPHLSDSEVIESDVATVLELLNAFETCTTEEMFASVPLEKVDATALKHRLELRARALQGERALENAGITSAS